MSESSSSSASSADSQAEVQSSNASHLDITFDINGMEEADEGGVAHLVDLNIPDSTGLLDRDHLVAALRAAPSTSLVKVAQEVEEEGMEYDNADGMELDGDIYGVVSHVDMSTNADLLKGFYKLLSNFGLGALVTRLSEVHKNKFRVLVNEQLPFVPQELITQVLAHSFSEAYPTTADRLPVLVFIKARDSSTPLVQPIQKKKKVKKAAEKRAREEEEAADEIEFFRPEDTVFFEHREVDVSSSRRERRIPFPREYEDQPFHEIPFALAALVMPDKFDLCLKGVEGLLTPVE
eukprot:PhM_4_TR4455/c0_g1_i1/m.65346